MANDKTPSPENKVAAAYVEVTTTGIPEVKRQLEEVKKATEEVAASQEAGQKKATAATKQTEGSFDDLVKALSGDAKQAVDKANESMAGGQKKVKDATKEAAKEAESLADSFGTVAAVSTALTSVVNIVSDMAERLARVNEQLQLMQLRAAQLENRGAFNQSNSPMTSADTQSYAGMDPLAIANLDQEIAKRQAMISRDEAISAYSQQVNSLENPLMSAANIAATLRKTALPFLSSAASDSPESMTFTPSLGEIMDTSANGPTRREEIARLRAFRSSFSPRLQGARAGSFTTQSNYEQQRGTLDAMQNMTLNDSSEATQELLRQILSELKRGSMRP